MCCLIGSTAVVNTFDNAALALFVFIVASARAAGPTNVWSLRYLLNNGTALSSPIEPKSCIK